MPLTEVKKKNALGITHVHSHFGGVCEYGCEYCLSGWRHLPPHREIQGAMDVEYGSGKVILLEPNNDLFAESNPVPLIEGIIAHCNKWPDNLYVMQSRNTLRMGSYKVKGQLPPNVLLGTTMESDVYYPVMGESELPCERLIGMKLIKKAFKDQRLFVAVEPVFQFTRSSFAKALVALKPELIVLGALAHAGPTPEPTGQDLVDLAQELERGGIRVLRRHTLKRLMKRKP